MVRLGFWRSGAGLTTSTPRGLPARGPRLDETYKIFILQPTIWFRDSAPAHKVFGLAPGNSHSLTQQLDSLKRRLMCINFNASTHRNKVSSLTTSLSRSKQSCAP